MRDSKFKKMVILLRYSGLYLRDSDKGEFKIPTSSLRFKRGYDFIRENNYRNYP